MQSEKSEETSFHRLCIESINVCRRFARCSNEKFYDSAKQTSLSRAMNWKYRDMLHPRSWSIGPIIYAARCNIVAVSGADK